jgi:hypothetical protein
VSRDLVQRHGPDRRVPAGSRAGRFEEFLQTGR